MDNMTKLFLGIDITVIVLAIAIEAFVIVRWLKKKLPAVIGVDHGYGNIKTANVCFPTGVTAWDAALKILTSLAKLQ